MDRPILTNIQIAFSTFIAVVVWTGTNNIVTGLIVGLASIAISYGTNTGYALAAWQWTTQYRVRFWHWLKSLFAHGTGYVPHLSIPIGYDAFTRVHVTVGISKLGSAGVFAQTGGGKTTLLHTIIHNIISRYAPSEIRLAISDMKDGIDFSIYHRLPHLFCPVAESVEESERMLKLLKSEMAHRAKLFKAFSAKHLCNDLTRYHALIDKMELSFERLPYIVAVFEEAQDIAKPNSETEQMLIDVAKKGRAYGIYLICATQRNTRGVMTGELQEQFTSRFCGYMDSNQEYAHVGRVPKETYELMEKLPGRFMMKYSGTWEHVQVKLTPDHELERIAAKVSGRNLNPVWPTASNGIPGNKSDKIAWNGTQAQKLTQVRHWINGFSSKPTIDNFLAVFDVKSSSTASHWINRVWHEEK